MFKKYFKKLFRPIFAIVFVAATLLVGKIIFDSIYPAFKSGYFGGGETPPFGAGMKAAEGTRSYPAVAGYPACLGRGGFINPF